MGEFAPPSLPSSLAALQVLRFFRLGKILRELGSPELKRMLAGMSASVWSLLIGSLLIFIVTLFASVLSVYFLKDFTKDVAADGGFGTCTHCERAFDSGMR